ncbi:hypothetical protein vBDshSR4C_035 [Dinoroseobacter phage vB_DshS-R4C]|nr:hypothetical protein vBDshSR4C_035 [Dinoroseobacter phage vB_DshS-R4C]
MTTRRHCPRRILLGALIFAPHLPPGFTAEISRRTGLSHAAYSRAVMDLACRHEVTVDRDGDIRRGPNFKRLTPFERVRASVAYIVARGCS